MKLVNEGTQSTNGLNTNPNPKTPKKYAVLPAINLSQKLFQATLPSCDGPSPAPCCTNSSKLQNWYVNTPMNLWDSASNYEGGPGSDQCTETALARQAFLSQYFNYLSHNNVLDTQEFSNKEWSS